MKLPNFVIAGLAASGISLAFAANAADTPTAQPPVGKAAAPGLVAGGMSEYNVGWRWLEATNSSDRERSDGVTFGMNTFYSMPLSGTTSVQFDSQSEYFTHGVNGHAGANQAGVLGVHMSSRNPQDGLVGLFAGVPYAKTTGTSLHGGWMAGVEAQKYYGNLTLYGQVGFSDLRTDNSGGEGFRSDWFGRGVARYFTSEDSMIQADLSYGRTSHWIDRNDFGKFWYWSIKGISPIGMGKRVYGTLEYRGSRLSSSDQGGDVAKEHIVLVGISVPLGAVRSLKHNDRYGATLDMPMLPARAGSMTETLD